MSKVMVVFEVTASVLVVIFLGMFFIFGLADSLDPKTLRGVKLGGTSEPAVHGHISDLFDIVKVVDAQLPTRLIFDPDGRMFYSQLNGEIYVVDEEKRLFATVPDSQQKHESAGDGEGEAGAMSLALDPDFDENRYVYVYYVSGESGKIGRFTEIDGEGRDFEIILDGVPFYRYHNGGDLVFGPDGKLYLSTGDATDIKKILKENNPAQDVNNKAGKILRINKDGSIPEDNPFPGTYTYALGFRNVFGFDIDQSTGLIFAADQGIDCCEELNVVEEGKNYGWAIEMGFNPESDFEDPIYAWGKEDRVVPTGILFYTGNSYGSDFAENIFMVTWRTREIYRFVMDETGKDIEEVGSFAVPDQSEKQPLVSGNFFILLPRVSAHAGEVHEGQVRTDGSAVQAGGLFDIEQGPEGLLYFSDVKGIYKLLPKQ